jgi:hypothetical protein
MNMNLKTIGWSLLGLGILVTFLAFSQDTAPEGTHNMGLMQTQMMLLHTGLVLALGGGLVTSIGAVVQRMEEAGLLPPAGVRPSLGTLPKGDGM